MDQPINGTTAATTACSSPTPSFHHVTLSSANKPYANYRFRAVIDWIELRVVTERPTNFPTIRGRMNVPFANPLNAGPGGAATEFKVKIHDPESWASLLEILSRLTHDHALAESVGVIGIEISLDAYSRQQDRNELIDMVTRFYKFSTVMVSSNRRTSGRGRGSPQGIGMFKSLRRRVAEGFNVYVGNKNDPTYQHLYLKETTKQNNQVVQLPVDEHRARTEITFQGKDLAHTTLAGWTNHDFTSEARFFKYRKLKTHLNPFVKSALEYMDQVGEKRVRRRACGGTRQFSAGTVADTALNALTYSALRELTKRMKA